MGTDDLDSAADVASRIARLIASGARLRADALRPVREYVVAHALRRGIDVPAQREIGGLRVWRTPIRAGDPIDVRLAKYLRHAVRQEQWPGDTTVDEYLQSLVEVVESEDGGIFADRRGTRWVLSFVARSGIW